MSHQAVFGDYGGGIGHGGAGALRAGAQRSQPVPVRPRAQRTAFYGMALGAQSRPQAGGVALGEAREGRLCRHLPRNGRGLDTTA